MKEISWYRLAAKEVEKKLHTDLKNGLSERQVAMRQEQYGKNVFEREKGVTFLGRIARQLKSPLVFILLIAGAGTFALGEYLDMTVILIAVLINVVVGVVQEGRASLAFEKLVESQEKYATVIREGKKILILAQELVKGDIAVVEAGMYVPADIRIIEGKDVLVNEAALTGEWMDVAKDVRSIEKEARITDRVNMVWMGTLISSGTALGVVVETGNRTQLGAIAQSLAYEEESSTPLQKSIRKLAKFLAYATLAAVLMILIFGILRGEDVMDMLLVAIAVAVAAMPSGLPAAVTVVLALGMESILKRGGLVRNLLAAETLGSTTVILTDKTGTLTKAEMRVASIVTASSLGSSEKSIHGDEDVREVLSMAILTSDAFVEGRDEALSEWVVRGRPVERAVVLAGLESGIDQTDLLKADPRLDFLPFESKNRFSASLHRAPEKGVNRTYFSGSPELLLEHSSFAYANKGKEALTEEVRRRFSKIQVEKGKEGLRLIGIAYKDTPSWKEIPRKNQKGEEEIPTLLEGLVFAGFIVLHDPLRPEVRESIQTAREAGARVIMLTGDNAVTASKIAEEAGIKKKDGNVLTGQDIEGYSDNELAVALESTDVFARVLPEQKLRIARLLKSRGEVVAMTGDGINDAPALRSANIGVALGSGTEVAKEASDIILLNNSFSIIVRAIEEGRRVLDNLKKIVAYLLSTSFSEITVIGGALIMGLPLPLLPAQILWTNILEEGFMNFAFAFEPKEYGVMKRDPRSVSMKNILTKSLKQLIVLIAVITGVFLMLLYVFLLSLDLPIEKVRTIMFVALSIDSIFFTFSIKNLHRPIWKINMFSNRYLLFALLFSITMLLAAVFLPPIQNLLSLTPLSPFELFATLAVGVFNLLVIELAKYIVFERRKQHN
ncbi:MAG: cation-transporting P-type ATPase [Patescibacteria group bacterium]|nr:MAG: cation-transporting P-type ATPase [Patescibacteria group bacterium]